MNESLWFVLALPALGACFAQVPLREGASTVTVRGAEQTVYYFPGGAGRVDAPCVLFVPGDGGWRGFAIAIARQVSSWGYDVYGLDTKRYLESFTGKTTLTEADVQGDFRRLADAVRGRRRVLLIGWSEGAGLAALAAAAPSKEAYAGLITMGLGDTNILGWRFADNLTYLTRERPREPTFSVMGYMPGIAPLPLFMLHSERDEYVEGDEARNLFALARDPKRFSLVQGRNHRFEGAEPEFFRKLNEGIEWARTAAPRP